jgi:RNA polymerase sigma factor (sigma-70 family)
MADAGPGEPSWEQLLADEDWDTIHARLGRVAARVHAAWNNPRVTPDDIVSECEFKLFTRLAPIRQALAGCATPELQEAYVAVLVRRVAIDLWRRDLRHLAATVKAVTARGVPSPSVESLGEDVLSLVALVEEPHRTILRLRFVEERSMDEIARELGVPYATVGTRIHRALKRLGRAARLRLGDDVSELWE